MRTTRSIRLILVVLLATLGSVWQAAAAPPTEDARDREIQELRHSLEQLSTRLQTLEEERTIEKQEGERLDILSEKVERIESAGVFDRESTFDKFHVGGYGEMHGNFGEGDSDEKFDIHRLVLYLGYDFNDWIKFHSETEIEHAFVSDESGGELSIEQIYIDFLLSDPLNVRLGRILTPMGIINNKHEPPSFNGVERPSFARVLIPSTWSSDGIGLFGNLTPSLQYELYLTAGLDGSEFDDTNGIRGGRIKERPSFNDPAVTGRLDYFPFAESAAGYAQTLRLGASAYAGGLDNGNNGDDPDVDGDIQIYSGDFEYTILDFDFRGVLAFEDIDGARKIGNGTASEIFGWYVEAGYHFWPDIWKVGKLDRSDAVVFARYEDLDTQYDMPSGVADNPKGGREQITTGLNLYLTPSFVLKADYQFLDDDSDDDPDNLFNVGAGWQF